MNDVAAPLVIAGDKIQPPERFPKTAPLGVPLPRARNAVGIGADREERGVAEVQQPGKTDNNVETQGEGSESERVCRRVDVRVVAVYQRKQQRRCGNYESANAGTGACGDTGKKARGPNARQSSEGAPHDFVGVARPKSPVGAKTSTRTRIEKMITSVHRTAIR